MIDHIHGGHRVRLTVVGHIDSRPRIHYGLNGTHAKPVIVGDARSQIVEIIGVGEMPSLGTDSADLDVVGGDTVIERIGIGPCRRIPDAP